MYGKCKKWFVFRHFKQLCHGQTPKKIKIKAIFTVQAVLIQLQLLLRKGMGCSAICGNSSSIYQPNKYSQEVVLNLIPLLKHSNNFISQKQYNQFLREIKQNPLKYRLNVSNKIVPQEEINPGILRKWKVILYCLDTSNSQYNNCLGHGIRIANKKINIGSQTIKQYNDQQYEIDHYKFQDEKPIIPHKEFAQIEKDLDRTCDLPQNKKKPFQNVLKRITNHFPVMGYTQGINFIIGYLLTIGYSEFDAFWMFVHIAINKRYLLLGLFEDGFPLSEIYKTIFRNVLKRNNPQIYHHLYETLEKLGMNQSVWVFKWFFTYFIYSFPHQMIKYVFDIVIQMGGIGLIAFAIGIIQQLGSYLLLQNDVGQVSMFFQSLRDINTFNKYININMVVQRAYSLQIKKEDFQGINDGKDNFYVTFILGNLEQNMIKKQYNIPEKTNRSTEQKAASQFNLTQLIKKNSKSDTILEKWYGKLTSQREQFIKQFQKNKQRNKKATERLSIQAQIQTFLIQNQSAITKSPTYQCQNQNQNKNSIKGSVEIKYDTTPSTGYSFNRKSSRLRNADIASQIDQLWDEENDNMSNISRKMSSKISQQSRTQNGFDIKVHKPTYQDELDKLASTQNIDIGKIKLNSHSKTTSIFSNQKFNTFKPKINNFQALSQKNNLNNFIRAGQSILNNLSMSNTSHYESSQSQSSKCSKYRQKRQKQNEINLKSSLKGRSKKVIHYDQHAKIRTSEEKQVIDQCLSQHDSYIQPRNSICVSNQSIHEQIRNEYEASSMKAFQSHRQRITTHPDIFVNSLQVSQIKQTNSKYAQSIGSQIQIFQAHQVFKKKNRVSSKISGPMNSPNYQNLKKIKMTHTISDVDILQKQHKGHSKGGMLKQFNYEQSYESIFLPSEGKKSTNFCYQEQLQKYQIESVK